MKSRNSPIKTDHLSIHVCRVAIAHNAKMILLGSVTVVVPANPSCVASDAKSASLQAVKAGDLRLATC